MGGVGGEGGGGFGVLGHSCGELLLPGATPVVELKLLIFYEMLNVKF